MIAQDLRFQNQSHPTSNFVEFGRECPLKKRNANQMYEILDSATIQNTISVKLTKKEAGRDKPVPREL